MSSVSDYNFVPGHALSSDLKLIAPLFNTQGGKLSAQTNPQAYQLHFNGPTYTFMLTKKIWGKEELSSH